jgi:hypothetical protein
MSSALRRRGTQMALARHMPFSGHGPFHPPRTDYRVQVRHELLSSERQIVRPLPHAGWACGAHPELFA